MANVEVKQQALALVERNPLVMMVGTLGQDGAPEIKAMVKMRNDGLRRFWFCSNTSTRHTVTGCSPRRCGSPTGG